MSELKVGDRAPDFTLPVDEAGGTVSLNDFRGKHLVLYFYPKDDTSGCTTEAIAFTALEAEFKAAGATVLGVSPDSCHSHQKFKAKYDISVLLASDESKEVLQRYGVWVMKSMYGREYLGVARTTLLIGPDGRIERIWHKVKVDGHADEVLEAVRAAKVAA